MMPSLKFWSFAFWSLFVFCDLSFGAFAQSRPPVWPSHYSASYGFELMTDHNGTIIVSSVDSTTQAYKLGVRPGMELLGWNTLPVRRKLESMNIRKYRKIFPLETDLNIKLILLTRGRPNESAEVFFVTETGNNRGIRLTTQQSSPSPVSSAR